VGASGQPRSCESTVGPLWLILGQCPPGNPAEIASETYSEVARGLRERRDCPSQSRRAPTQWVSYQSSSSLATLTRLPVCLEWINFPLPT
jgi:hypothetical protein